MVFAIHQQVRHKHTYALPSQTPLPHPSPPHPSRLSQSTGLGCPPSCIKLALVIYFTYGDVCFNAILSNHPTLSSH